MWPFENGTFEDIHYSRFVASWVKTRGKIDWRFKEWLENIEINGKKMPEDVINEIYELGTCGKMELECDIARKYPK